MHHEGFLLAIGNDPYDDTPRLVYADWLEEQGDGERAEFIRVQCRLSMLPHDDPDVPRLRGRETKLLRKHKSEWWDEQVPGVDTAFARGFPSWASCRADTFLTHSETLRRLLPVLRLRLSPGEGSLATILQTSAVASIHHLELMGWPIGHEGLRLLCETPLDCLRGIGLISCELGEEAGILVNAPWFTQINVLDLPGNRLGVNGLRMLLESPRFQRITDLNLAGGSIGLSPRGDDMGPAPNVGEEGIVLLCNSPAAERLIQLNLHDNFLGDAGHTALAGSRFLKRLTGLRLGGASISPQYVLPVQLRQSLEARFGAALTFKGYWGTSIDPPR